MKPILLCLHGWGGSRESFAELRDAISSTKVEILIPDLPGFGNEPDPKKPWTIDDYADWVELWLKEHAPDLWAPMNTRPFYLLGHSHGGRISIKLAARKNFPVDHLFLCAAAGIHHSRHTKRIFGLTLAKAGKALLSIPGLDQLQPLGKKLLYKLVRVHDYEKASPVMRQTLILVTREDLQHLLEKIKVPTDIFWGIDDQMTPVSDGKIMQEKIKGSRLHLYPGVRHRVHREKAQEIGFLIMKTAEDDERRLARA
ncbi:MAG: alpha/beta hydrolase [Candidatus Peribacteria bacterium]|nr:alpha/beta hydrolase [Candidatus Peribacteria bacterium]